MKKLYKNIIQKLFTKKEEKLSKYAYEAISGCHIILRKTFGDPSIVSLREIPRISKYAEYFQDYFLKK